INPSLKVGGVMVCMHDSSTRLAAEVIEEVRTFIDKSRGTDVPWSSARLFETPIRRNIKLAEAPSYGKSIFDYAPQSNGAKDYARLSLEIHDPAALCEPVDKPAGTSDKEKTEKQQQTESPVTQSAGLTPTARN
ncbi:MAG: ParA family protein, partial [Planctomycetota bacterium]